MYLFKKRQWNNSTDALQILFIFLLLLFIDNLRFFCECWQPVSSTEAKVHRGYLHSVNQTLANYTVGDYIRFTTKGDWYYTDGAHTRRITGIKADESSNWITFTLGDVFDGVKVTVE